MINRKKLIEELSKDYEAELKEMTNYVLDRSELWLEPATIDNAEHYLLSFDPEWDHENTAREAWYLQAMRSMIGAVRNFNSLWNK